MFRIFLSASWAALLVSAGVGMMAESAQAVQPKGAVMSYGEARKFLASSTRLVELVNDRGARVAICPEWQGRVMTSTCGGLDGPSFGFIHREFIERGQHDPHFNNQGGEDRMWLSPEGGQFSLWFKPGAAQTLDNWFTPPALNEGPFAIVSRNDDPFYRLVRRMRFQNASGTPFDLDVNRDIRLLNEWDLVRLFGREATELMNGPTVKMVGYETINTITNRGPAMTKEKGLVSIWMLGMFNASPETVVLAPYKPGPESELGPVIKSDYFGPVPADRLKITPEAVFFRADANYRSKLGTSQKRARNVLGSIDFAGRVLTIVHFTMPEDPTKHDYMNNMWELPQAAPYVGDVVNTYNDGPPAPGKKGLGPFYEIESLSPAKALATGESLTHQHRTLHIQADLDTLAQLAKTVLGVDLAEVQRQMLAQ
jgi:hypothetical protein